MDQGSETRDPGKKITLGQKAPDPESGSAYLLTYLPGT
jgi:hypothetical protein